MAELDFTALNNLAYRGFKTAEERERKDELIEKGYTYLPDEVTPFNTPQNAVETPQTALKAPPPQQAIEIPTQAKQALKGQIKPFKSIDGETDYRELYRDVFKFHEKYNPPELDLTGEEGGYWWRAGEELTQLAGKYHSSKLSSDLLLAVFRELETEYKKLVAQNKDKQPPEV